MIQNMDEQAARELLKAQGLGHLGVVLKNGNPYVVPINYVYFEEAIYLHSLPGAKLDALRANGRVCLQVEKVEPDCRWQSAIAFGAFREIEKADEKNKVLREFERRFERLTPVEAMGEGRRSFAGVVVFRIDIERVTGRAED